MDVITITTIVRGPDDAHILLERKRSRGTLMKIF